MSVVVGVIGTGLMGKPMAHNLLRAGYRVVVWNRTTSKLKDLVDAGAVAAASPKEVAQQAFAIITMLIDWETTHAAIFGPNGVMEGIRPGSLFIDMGTTSPAHARELADAFASRDVDALDAPVSGGEKGAIEGTLTVMAGGSEAAFERAKPIFAAMAKTYVRIGEAGAGQIAKMCNQLIVASTVELVAEAFALARAHGVDPAVVRQAMLGGFAGSKILEGQGQRMLDRNFAPGGPIKTHMKDRENILDACARVGLELPVAKAAFERVKMVVDRGDGELDHTALYKLYDEAGVAG
ncbi:MAG: NAD-binding protein [Candidatus Eremiobacteraeota bacterium]|nr:NAD-binding protein [Candidatus Eremiobacteraeota bacterium]